MLATGDMILALIPQRPPMVMVDKLVSCDELMGVASMEVKKDNIFVSGGSLSASGLLETMAQTEAARTGWLLKNMPEQENKNVPVGVIGNIKNLKIYFRPLIGSIITSTVKVEFKMMNATLVKGKVEVNGELAAEAELQVFLMESER